MIGIVGGSGLCRLEQLQVTEVRDFDTPFGNPSSPLVLGSIGGRRVAFLARHGQHHDLLPSETNFRANVYTAGLTRVQEILKSVVEEYVDDEDRPCRRTLAEAVLTPAERLTPPQRELLALLRR